MGLAGETRKMATIEELKNVKRRHSADLRRLPGICGVDIDEDAAGDAVLTVYLDTDDPETIRSLPSSVEGHPIKYVQGGPFEKQ
jgi:hypothetical protein